MPFFPPLPRYRLYSAPWAYLRLLRGLIFGTAPEGREIAALEQEVCRRFGTAHALCVNQARVGIHLAVKALVSERRRRVVMSPYTIFEIVNMVITAGGEPVFADIERETCNIDPAEVEALIDDRTAAVLVTHLHGLACDVERIARVCRDRGVALIEDAAQAVGAQVNGRRVGTLGDVGIFSFGMMKNVSSFFGGMVLTDNPELHAAMTRAQAEFPPMPRKRLLFQGLYGLVLEAATFPLLFRAVTFWLFRYGYLHRIGVLMSLSRSENHPALRDAFPDDYRFRMRDVQARLARAQLGGIDDHYRSRHRTARLYHDGLSDISDLILPPMRSDGSHAYMMFAIQAPDREALLRYLMRNGRDVAGQHLRNCADLPCFAAYARDCPNARLNAGSTVLLPTYPRYGLKQARKTLEAVRAFYRTHNSRTEEREPDARHAA